jgi:flagellin
MSRINTNVAALIGLRHLSINNDELSLRLERLSTGLRINRGRDDPAGLIASERLRSDIRGIQQAVENSSRAANVVLTAEGALHEVSALLLDLQALIVQSANEAGLTEEEVTANQLQIDSILASIDRIADTTAFADKKLLDGSQAY